MYFNHYHYLEAMVIMMCLSSYGFHVMTIILRYWSIGRLALAMTRWLSHYGYHALDIMFWISSTWYHVWISMPYHGDDVLWEMNVMLRRLIYLLIVWHVECLQTQWIAEWKEQDEWRWMSIKKTNGLLISWMNYACNTIDIWN